MPHTEGGISLSSQEEESHAFPLSEKSPSQAFNYVIWFNFQNKWCIGVAVSLVRS